MDSKYIPKNENIAPPAKGKMRHPKNTIGERCPMFEKIAS